METLFAHTTHLQASHLPLVPFGSFNLLDLIDVREKELPHSRIIADLLHPDGTHGLGDALLRPFLRRLGLKSDRLYWSVRCEEKHHRGRWDISLRSPDGQLVIVENKINAPQRENQLTDYVQDAVEEGIKPENIWLLYLTPDGRRATSITGKSYKINYCEWSYRGNIREWLEECMPASSHNPRVYHSLAQYRDLLVHFQNCHTQQKLVQTLADHIISNRLLFEAQDIVEAFTQAKIQLQLAFWKELEEALEKKKIPLETHNYTYDAARVERYYRSRNNNKGFGLITVLETGTRNARLQLWIEVEDRLSIGLYAMQGDKVMDSAAYFKRGLARERVEQFIEKHEWELPAEGDVLAYTDPGVELHFRQYDDATMLALSTTAKRTEIINAISSKVASLHRSFKRLV